MATYFVASGGSNTAPYDTWAKAATSLQTALTAATTAGDVVVIQYDAVPSTDTGAVDRTYTFGGSVSLISASNDGGSAFTPTAMGTTYYIGNNAGAYSYNIATGAHAVYVYGITLRNGTGAATDPLQVNSSNNSSIRYENCYFWLGSTGSGSTIYWTTTDRNMVVEFYDCTFRFSNTGQKFGVGGRCFMSNCSISSAGSAITSLFDSVWGDGNACDLVFDGCDFSAASSTATLLTDSNLYPVTLRMSRCKLPSSFVAIATQTDLASGEVWLFDCSTGDTHGLMGYYSKLGSVVSDTGIYYTSGAAAQSWKVVTTADCSFRAPFFTPWIDLYHTGTSAITPWIEILRDGSATAYKDNEVWAEFSVKTTTGSVVAGISRDRQALSAYFAGTAGGNQAAGAGTGSWTGEGGTAWSGKCDSGSSITPAESGHIRGRIVVAAASTTVYVDPQIRTA